MIPCGISHIDRLHHPSSIHNMSAIRRLSDTDVRAIFESVHGNHLPPPNLSFQVVRVGPKGLKLSPPSFQFAGELISCLQKGVLRFGSYSSHFLIDTQMACMSS